MQISYHMTDLKDVTVDGKGQWQSIRLYTLVPNYLSGFIELRKWKHLCLLITLVGYIQYQSPYGQFPVYETTGIIAI